MWIKRCLIALKFPMRLGSVTAETPEKFQSDDTIVPSNLATLKRSEIWWKNFFPLCEPVSNIARKYYQRSPIKRILNPQSLSLAPVNISMFAEASQWLSCGTMGKVWGYSGLQLRGINWQRQYDISKYRSLCRSKPPYSVLQLFPAFSLFFLFVLRGFSFSLIHLSWFAICHYLSLFLSLLFACPWKYIHAVRSRDVANIYIVTYLKF